MATILRSNVTLSAPRPGMRMLPPLGADGALHRWHAETVLGAPGSAVTLVPDAVGSSPLNTLAGSVTIQRSASGARYLDFSAGVGNGSFQNRIYGAGSEDNTAFTLVGLLYWEAAPGGSYGVLNTNTSSVIQGVSVDAANNRIAAYSGSGGPILNSPASPRTGWHTVVVAYRKNGEEALSLDGGAIVRGEAHTSSSPAVNSFGISGRPEHKVRVMDYAFFGRALTDAEHAGVHAALAAQIPA